MMTLMVVVVVVMVLLMMQMKVICMICISQTRTKTQHFTCNVFDPLLIRCRTLVAILIDQLKFIQTIQNPKVTRFLLKTSPLTIN